MKKTLLLLLLLVVSLLIVGCGATTSNPSPQENPDNQTPGTEPEVPGPGATPENPTPEIPTLYTITWFDENGALITSESVEAGTVPHRSYSVSDTAEWDYTFNGWASVSGGTPLTSLPIAAENASYYAVVTRVKQRYTVSFDTKGGSTVASQTVEYGAKATQPDNPTYDGYKFMGWTSDANGQNVANFDLAVTTNVKYYANWNKVVNAKALLSALLSGFELNPYSYIPESMLPSYSKNLVDADDVVSDYSSFVNIADISYGFGEQWHMIIDNLEQSKVFFNALSVVEGLSATSISIFNNYFDKNPSDTARHTFSSGTYEITIDVNEENIFYIVEFDANIPAIGSVSAQIALSMNIESGEKTARIQLGDANALSYKIRENSYEFAIKYLGVRRAMFSIERNDDGSVNGKIYEYLTVADAEIGSCAEFYIDEEYVSVVGNKASGMIGFTGTICELYDAEGGVLIGYEVEETLSKIVYNTLWFNLNDISGITSIKYQAATEDEVAKIFVNGLSRVWEAKNVGGIGLKMLSRRFDIEYRTQYVYSYDSESGKYIEHKIEVPMLFVQEENRSTLVADVRSTNNVTISVGVSSADENKLLSDYDTLLPTFKENKEKITAMDIVSYIGKKIEF